MKTKRFCPHCARPVLKSNDKSYDFVCYACELALYRSDTISNKKRIEIIYQFVFSRNYYGKPIPSYKKAYPRQKNKKFRIAYMLDSLKMLNYSFDRKYGLKKRDVYMANAYVNIIENSRSKMAPKEGDTIRLTTKHGNYYPNAHIDEIKNGRVKICEHPSISFINRSKKGISCDTSGGAWCGVSIEKLTYIGKELKLFKDWGNRGVCGNGAIYFEAEVNVWEYIDENLLYPGFSTKNWHRYYVYENPDPDEFYQYSIGKSLKFKTEKELNDYIQKFNGTIFPGNYNNQQVLWCYKNELVPIYDLEEWECINLPKGKEDIYSHIRDTKLLYDHKNHVLQQFYLAHTTSIKNKKEVIR